MRVGPGSVAPLLERDGERRALDWAVDQACQGNGEVVVIEGVAGVGKTSLLQLAGARSSAAGMRILRARAALRTLGLVTGGAEGVELLRAAVATLEGTDGRLDHARALLELGVALRHQGARTEARDTLRLALDETARIGASGLADRAHQELVAAGARPRRDRRLLSGRESLTAGEDRVALLAAQGLTNREIAQRQFVTVKAVQWHLRNIYRKLDVTSREDLPSALHLGS